MGIEMGVFEAQFREVFQRTGPSPEERNRTFMEEFHRIQTAPAAQRGANEYSQLQHRMAATMDLARAYIATTPANITQQEARQMGQNLAVLSAYLDRAGSQYQNYMHRNQEYINAWTPQMVERAGAAERDVASRIESIHSHLHNAQQHLNDFAQGGRQQTGLAALRPGTQEATPAEYSLQLGLTQARAAIHELERLPGAMAGGQAVIAERDTRRAEHRRTNEAVAAIGVSIVAGVALAPLAAGSIIAEMGTGAVSTATGSVVSQASARGSVNAIAVAVAAVTGAILVPVAHGAAHGISHAFNAIRGSSHVVGEALRESGIFAAEGGVSAAAVVMAREAAERAGAAAVRGEVAAVATRGVIRAGEATLHREFEHAVAQNFLHEGAENHSR